VGDCVKEKWLTPIDVKLQPHNSYEEVGACEWEITFNEVTRVKQCIWEVKEGMYPF